MTVKHCQPSYKPTEYRFAASYLFAQKAEIVVTIVDKLSNGLKSGDLTDAHKHSLYLIANYLASIVTDGPFLADNWLHIEALALMGRDAKYGKAED